MVSGLLLGAVLVVLAVLTWQAVAEQRRHDAAWRRVGSCALIPDTERVSCQGVSLVTLRLPSQIAACGGESGGVCSVKVNREALPAFQSAVAEIVASDLGQHVSQFQTVNRRPCRDSVSARVIPGCISKHSYGIAADFRPFEDNANWAQVQDAEPGLVEVVAIFQRHGFKWGGNFDSNFDPQHVEWVPK